MKAFHYKNDHLYVEKVLAQDIAEQYGTPCYVYSRAAFESHYLAYANAMSEKDLVCYAVKANSNIALLNILARLGSGFDIVSAGELERVLLAGGDPAKVVFSGVAKTEDEMKRALELGIHCFNVESASELARLNRVANTMGLKAPVSIRVNPDVDAQTHPYISTGLRENKFGIHFDDVMSVYQKAHDLPNIDLIGIDCHIGSQLTRIEPFLDALDKVLEVVEQLESAGIKLKHIDLGGGLGVKYDDEEPPEPGDYIQQVQARLSEHDLALIIEPGRSIAANAGILLTRVEYLKNNGDKHFALVDAGMNDMLRPSLYQAWMEIRNIAPASGITATFDLVGPVCETGDFLGKDRLLTLSEGDILAQFSAGAYGFTMASNYNTRPRAAEVIIDGEKSYIIRQRETLADLVRGESLLP